ncbi:MAG: MerR family DNA-binding transcriptional regulator [Rhodospirillaceae bacterium]|nr:MerR family DNA-binding transcriptional regulator [Rhodospirillaceae bacterium]MBL6942720.1 MerR family DNA-binding transcriptional regulator [Rhodospirillales bacterium]
MIDIYGIAELAREFNVTTRTIRFYEDKGLLSPERQGQRRVYSSRDRVRLRLIMRGKRLGFSLSEIREMIDLYDDDPSEVAQLKLFLSKIRERQAVLNQQQADIAAIVKELNKLESESAALLEQKEAAR